MLRKICQLSILSVLSPACFSGLYIGAAIGPEGAHFSQNNHVVGSNPQAPEGSFDVIDKNHFSGIGGFGSIFAGYGLTRDRWYLAGEINANLSSLEYQMSNVESMHGTVSKTTFTIKNSEGISLLPGYFLAQDTLFYGRVGWVNGSLKIKESDPTIQSFNGSRNGIRYGLGFRHNLTSQWIAMMDYSQINYSSVKSYVFDPAGMVTKDSKITPNTAQVAFGILYSFDTPKTPEK